MRLAALIVGIFGSVAAFVSGLLILLLAGLGAVVGEEGDEGAVAGITVFALLIIAGSVVTLVGAALSMARPRFAAGMMFGAGFFGPLYLSWIAALLAFLGRYENQPNAQDKERMPTWAHVVVTICTGGLWLPGLIVHLILKLVQKIITTTHGGTP